MRIPHKALADDTLRNLIEEFVTREGTDYGDRLYSLEDKVAQVRRQLDQGSVVIVYDPHAESCHIMPMESGAPGMEDEDGSAATEGANDSD
jgi:uncharacterized protein